MTDRQKLILQTAATVAARVEPDHLGFDYHDSDNIIAWVNPEYPSPEKVAERSIAIAMCLINAVADK